MAGAPAQSAREVRVPSPYFAIENEPAPKLIVDPPLPDQLSRGIVQIQYRVENVRLVPVFGIFPLEFVEQLDVARFLLARCVEIVLDAFDYAGVFGELVR